jgi:hypothetical protein
MRLALSLVCMLYATGILAADVDEYRRRAAQRDIQIFNELDRNKDRHLTVEEVQGNIDLTSRFNDIDINRDGVITLEELSRYIANRYQVALNLK